MQALVADDSVATRRLLAQLLEEAGYAVESAADGAEALDLLREASRAGRPFDVLLTDWRMPRMDGLALLRATRADPRLRDLPVVVVSSLADAEAVATLLAEGARAFVAKPFVPDDVRSVLWAVRLPRVAPAAGSA